MFIFLKASRQRRVHFLTLTQQSCNDERIKWPNGARSGYAIITFLVYNSVVHLFLRFVFCSAAQKGCVHESRSRAIFHYKRDTRKVPRDGSRLPAWIFSNFFLLSFFIRLPCTIDHLRVPSSFLFFFLACRASP